MRNGAANECGDWSTLAAVTNDEESRKRLKNIETTRRRLDKDQTVVGWPRLAELLGEHGHALVGLIHKWLGLISGNCGNSGKEPLTPQPWPDLIPIGELPDVPAFPVEVLPGWMADWSMAQSDALQVPVDLMAMLALTYGSAGMARKVVIEIRPGWVEPSNLFTVSSMPPGERKSAALTAALGPLQLFEKDQVEKARPRIAEAETEKRQLEARLKRLEGRIAKSDCVDERNELREQAKEVALQLSELEPVVLPICFCDDETPESLSKLLADQGGRMLVTAAEGTVLEIVKGRYSESPVFDVFLKGHAGDPLRCGRVSRGREIVDRPALSVGLSVQPDVIQGLASDACLKGRGFLARFLYSVPASKVGNRKIAQPPAAKAIRDRYEALMRRLWEINYAEQEEDDSKPHVLRFTVAADEVMRAFESWLEPQLGPDGELAQMGGWANKLAGACARIAGVLHIARALGDGVAWTEPISVETVGAVLQLGQQYLLSHAQAAFSLMGTDPYVDGARRFGKWILEKRLLRFQKRDAYQALKGTFKTVEDLDPLLSLLEKHYIIRPEPSEGRDGPGRKPSPYYQVHPHFLAPPSHNSHNSHKCPPDSDSGSSGNCGDRVDSKNMDSGTDHADGGKVAAAPFQCEPGLTEETPFMQTESEKPPAYVLVNDAIGLGMIATSLGEGGLVGLDVETTGLNPRSDRIRLLSLNVDTIDGTRFTYIVDCFAVDPNPLWEELAAKPLIVHNGAFDLAFLAQLGFIPTGLIHDTMLLAQVLTAGLQAKVTLADCSERWLGRPLDKSMQTSDWSGKLTGEQLEYAARDAELLVALQRVQSDEVAAAGLAAAASIENRCLPALVWMGQHGVCIDKPTWASLAHSAELDTAKWKDQLSQSVPAPAGTFSGMGDWNWDSPAQAIEALKAAGCVVEGTSDRELAAANHPAAQVLRHYRLAAKRVSSFGIDWLKHVHVDGRVYPQWWQNGASSGRMSCSNPNMQQLPRGDRRRCIVAPPGCVLVKADYSQVELRIAAKISGDPALLDAYVRGEDLHTLTARNVLKIAEVTKEHRQLAKALNFGLLYGMGAKGFRIYSRTQYGLEMTEDEARAYREAFFRAYPGLKKWHRTVGRSGDKAIETRTLAWRRRLGVVRFTEKLNTPVQGTEADGLKQALALLWERRDQAFGAFPVLAVHDEIVVECDQEQADPVKTWLKAAMLDGMAPLIAPVPVGIEVKIAKIWGGDRP